jgi:hypothetical protein
MSLRIEIVLALVAIAHRRLGATASASRGSNHGTRKGQADAREHGLDDTLAETFPCSDALSSIPNTAWLSNS